VGRGCNNRSATKNRRHAVVLTTYTQRGIIAATIQKLRRPVASRARVSCQAIIMQAAAITINVRAPAEVRDLIDRAANVQGKTRTDFILEASTEAAQRVLLDQVFFQVSEEQMKAFHDVMERPIKNNEAVRRLLAKKSPWER
jgi:uncharacterized protein (DUF1778 family)